MRPRSSCSFIANPMVLAFPLDTLAILQDVCNSHSGQAGKPLPARSDWLTRAAGFIPPSADVLFHDTCHPAIRRAVLRKFDILGRCVGASDNTLPPPAPCPYGGHRLVELRGRGVSEQPSCLAVSEQVLKS